MRCESCGFSSDNLKKVVVGTNGELKCRPCAGCIIRIDDAPNRLGRKS